MQRSGQGRETGGRRTGHRRAWAVLVGAAVALGLVAAPFLWSPMTLVSNAVAFFAILTLIAWVTLSCLDGEFRDVMLGGLRVAAVGVLLGIAVTSYVEMLGPAAWWLVALAVLTSPTAARLLRDRVRPALRGEPAVEEIPAGPTPAWLVRTDGVEEMSTTDLVLAWRASLWQLRSCRSAPELAHLVRVRQAYLDELERRDPAGIAAWISSGPRASTDLGTYLTGDAGPTEQAS
ncbi:MAG: hypothetical protein U0R80_06025 [Nocardioidaceae bacterium]